MWNTLLELWGEAITLCTAILQFPWGLSCQFRTQASNKKACRPREFLVGFTILFGQGSLSKRKEWLPTKSASDGENKIFMWSLFSLFLKWYEKGDEYNRQYSYFCSLNVFPSLTLLTAFSQCHPIQVILWAALKYFLLEAKRCFLSQQFPTLGYECSGEVKLGYPSPSLSYLLLIKFQLSVTVLGCALVVQIRC